MGARGARAAVLVEPGRYEIREYPLPEPSTGAALIKNELSGICGTDKHTFQGYTTQYSATVESSTPFPIIQGHENVGTVEALGGKVFDFDGQPLELGARVVLGPNVTCGYCYECRHQFPYTLCPNIRDYGNTMSAATPPHLFGGWAEYLYALPGSFIFRVPDELPSSVAVLTEVFAATVALDRAKQYASFPSEGFLFDDTVVVYGVGPLGLCHVLKARLLGAGTIIAVDLSDTRLSFAQRLGADYTINATAMGAPDRLAFVRDVTHGRGADVVIECAGVPEVVPVAIDLLRAGGTFLEVGNFSDLGDVAISPHRHLCSKGIRLIGIPGQEHGAYGPGMRQLARYRKLYPLDEFVVHRYPLEETKAAVEKSMLPDSLKVVIDPWGVRRDEREIAHLPSQAGAPRTDPGARRDNQGAVSSAVVSVRPAP
jgi:threonine dehydrogenase-like Zn-dependent dehydrogenase